MSFYEIVGIKNVFSVDFFFVVKAGRISLYLDKKSGSCLRFFLYCQGVGHKSCHFSKNANA